MTDKIKRIVGWTVFFIAFFGIALVTGWILGHRSAPEPKKTTVTGNPTQEQEKPATIVLKMYNQGQATGTAQIKPINAPGTNEGSLGLDVSIPSFGDPWASTGNNPGGFTASGPISGDIKTTVVNKRTGEELWVGESPLTGTVTATSLDGRNVGFDIKFDNEQTYAVDLPKEPPKRFEVGLLAGIDMHGKAFAGGYGRYDIADWELGKVEIAPWIGGAGIKTKDDFDGYLLVGIGGRF